MADNSYKDQDSAHKKGSISDFKSLQSLLSTYRRKPWFSSC